MTGVARYMESRGRRAKEELLAAGVVYDSSLLDNVSETRNAAATEKLFLRISEHKYFRHSKAGECN